MAGRLIKQSMAIASEGVVGKVNNQSNSIIEAVQEQSPLVVERGRTGAERSGVVVDRRATWAEMSEICTLKSCQRESTGGKNLRARFGRVFWRLSGADASLSGGRLRE